MKRQCIQDGAQFYDDATGELIAQYPEMVKHDYDMPGADAARARFLNEHPSCEMHPNPFRLRS